MTNEIDDAEMKKQIAEKIQATINKVRGTDRNGGCFAKISQALLELLDEINRSFQEEKCVVTENTLCPVVGGLKLILLEEPLKKEEQELMMEILLALFNWNANFPNDGRLDADLKMLERLNVLTLTSVELISTLKYHIQILNRFKEQIPSMVDLSEYYLRSLDKE